MGWFKTSVRLGEDYFELNKGLSRRAMQWRDIDFVYGEKIDKVTYEELFLIVKNAFGDRISVGELDQGFDALEDALHQNLEGFPVDWRQKLEATEALICEKIWSKRTAR